MADDLYDDETGDDDVATGAASKLSDLLGRPQKGKRDSGATRQFTAVLKGSTLTIDLSEEES